MNSFRIGMVIGCLVLIISACGGDGRSGFVVLPDGYRSVVSMIDHDTLVPIQELPFPSRAAVPGDTRRPIDAGDSMRVVAAAYDYIDYDPSGWITYMADLGRTFMVLKYDPVSGVVRHEDLQMPEGYEAYTATTMGDILYVGGNCGWELMGYFNLAEDSVSWTALDIPDSVAAFRKTIDGLLVHGNRLIAVDDLIFPKWFIRYDITNPAAPVLLDSKRIPAHGVYEHIRKAVIGSHWVATLSTTSGKAALGEHIALYDADSLTEVGSVTNERIARRLTGYRELGPDTSLSWESIEIYGDILLIAARDRGMAILDLSGLDRGEDISTQLEEMLTYRKYIGLPGSDYLNFMLVPPLDKVAVIVSRADSLDHILLTREELLTPNLWITTRQ